MRLKTLVCTVCMFTTAVAMGQPSADSSGEPSIEFPYVLKIAPGNVLVVYGHVIRNEVLVTWEPGDSLRVEGLPILPKPSVPRIVLSEHGLAKTYGRVDYVRERVDSGYTWRQATDASFQKRHEEIQSARAVYATVIDSTGSHEKAARAVSNSFDRSLLRPGYEPVVTLTHTSVEWQGGFTDHDMPELEFNRGNPDFKEIFKKTTEEGRACFKTRQLVWWLGGPGICVVMENPGGMRASCGDSARRAVAQIEAAEMGSIKEGRIDETDLRRIIDTQAPESE
ncbi:MAG: hypothetical protein ABIJ00_00350 [Candidatus Eisenbacteria bacterium]